MIFLCLLVEDWCTADAQRTGGGRQEESVIVETIVCVLMSRKKKVKSVFLCLYAECLWCQVNRPNDWPHNPLRPLKKRPNCYRVGAVWIMVRFDVCSEALYSGNSCTCRCRFPGPATFECLWRALGCLLSRWHCCSCRSWGTEWESGLQVPQLHRYGKSIFWLHMENKERKNQKKRLAFNKSTQL